MKKLIFFVLLFTNNNSFSQSMGLKPGDTAKFIGLPRTQDDPHGEARIWSDPKNLIHYAETWREDSDYYKWEGTINIDKDGIPRALLTQRSRNGVPLYTETTDSMIFLRNGKRTAEKVSSNDFRVPWGHSSALFGIYIQCALRLKQKEFKSANLGIIRARKVGNKDLKMGKRRTNLSLYILTSDSIPDLRHIWLDENNRLFSFPYAEGYFDFLPLDWQDSRDQLLEAEFLAAQANKKESTCGQGLSFNNCETGTNTCKLLTRTPGGGMKGSFTFADSGYSVRSDGLGPYVTNFSTIGVIVGPIGGMLINCPRSPERYYSIDLNHPVSGDIGVPLGVVKTNGWPGPFLPSGGGRAPNEISAQWYTETNNTQHNLVEIPIGKTEYAQQLVFDFYIDGLLYVMQMGPQPYGHCFSDVTAINGDSTTRGTITRESETKWVIDLPPGSIGRLFDNHKGDRNAINKGLYYVSLHYVIQR